MVDAPDGVRITPQPSHMRSSTSVPHAKRILTLITLIIIFSAISVAYYSDTSNSVPLLVRTIEGERMLYSVNVQNGNTTQSSGANEISIGEQQFVLSDGSTIELASAGVVHRAPGPRTFEVLVASPIAASARIPLAVWGDGALIAWVNPGDNSLQVFQKNVRGAYVPIYINSGLFPNSLRFTEEGRILIAAKIVGESTDLYSINVVGSTIERLATVSGLATLVP